MMRSTFLILILAFLLPEIALACENEQDKFSELSVDSSEYIAKPDKTKPAVKSVFGNKLKYPSLYCSTSTGSNCDENSVWFDESDFAKYLVGYKPVHCYHLVRSLKVVAGVEHRYTKFVVYYSGK